MSTQALAKKSDRMASLFEDFFRRPLFDFFDDSLTSATETIPAVNISEGKDGYSVTIASPGLEKDDFDIWVRGNILTISGEKEEEHEEMDKKFIRREYRFSSFKRSFTLPDDASESKIEASYMDGILKLTIPKKDETKRRVMARKVMVK